MNSFITDNFLLTNKTAQTLFHSVVSQLPVVDYHNHMNPQFLAENKQFGTIAELWVTGDPYKHRAMRINGIPELGITGNATDKEKYLNWVKTFPKTMGNPLFHWTCLELKHIFGIDELLSEQNAEAIWDHCNTTLQEEGFKAIDLLRKWNAEIVCTSDDLLDDLTPHKNATGLNLGLAVLPSLRSDSMIAFETPGFTGWLAKLSQSTGLEIKTLDQYKEALLLKLNSFDEAGCRLSDHSLDGGFVFDFSSGSNPDQLFGSCISGVQLSERELAILKTHILVFLGQEYGKRGWVMQLHIGAQRYTSSRLRKIAGPAGGYATIGQSCDIRSLCFFLDVLEQKGQLPRTILYTLNPTDNAAFATLTGSFSEDGLAGKVQFGPAWWYNDHYDGMRQQLIALSSYGLLNHFIGMTTDSRSILSFSRHEYFRRLLCNLIGEWVESGLLPGDFQLLNQLVADIAYNNSKNMILKR
ncbi:MAG: uronate isomerase [Bacteroidetes bacterium GWF2_42_66]|nr:MAG: uronate isomerase [Bacteroidetes bacterium GWA2_42_15]OFX96509.1 MAG: uronate isomerase [Bacteroidetes bacterium GWE2_42_39]OFY40929.1 MAG: uronate isomerase [Bacteroidetes bacterium GWF2_42_66]HBL76364.1 glucuronate isomerase [Prolixibacteraceae bacterium]HCR92082.1 glucuronate isomerase [Prolixibacteraceae bacterium]